MAASGDDWVDVAARFSRSIAESAWNRKCSIWCYRTIRDRGIGTHERFGHKWLAYGRVAIELSVMARARDALQLIGSHCEGGARRRTNGEKRSNRVSVLSHSDQSNLPSGNEPVPLEWELIETT